MLLVFSCAFFSPILGQAQLNLVKNGGFEQKYVCPFEADEVKDAKHWHCIDTDYVSTLGDSLAGDPNCSPEYCNICSANIFATAPANANFYQYPRSGNGIFDVGMYDSRGDTTATGSLYYHRDYLMGNLSSTLTAGQSYCVTFYVVMSNKAGYAIDHIGAYLDNGSIDTVSQCGITHTEYTPQVFATNIISDSVSWTKIQGSFIANGTEKYITIGNFFDTAHTNKIRMSGIYWSYYEVDDVSVIATGTHADAGPDVNINIGNNAYIGVTDSNGDGMPCYWYVLGGTSPIDSGGRILVHPTTTTSYVVSMDLCGVVTYDTVVVNVAQCPSPYIVSYTDTGNTHIKGFTYTGSTFDMDSVKWSFGDGTTSNALNPVHTYTANGHYDVCVKVYSYCGVDSSCTQIALAIPSLGAGGSVEIWPNPAKDELTIENGANSEIHIYNLIDSEVYKANILSDKENLHIGFLPSGVYVVQVVDVATGIGVVRKIVKG